MEFPLLIVTIIVVMSILLVPIVIRTGVPLLLLFLSIGMFLGVDGPGGIRFENFEVAYMASSGALAVILFAGGLETPLADLRKAGLPALLLATFGVLITAITVAIMTHWILGFPLPLALLLGAVVGSTDAAATFLLLQQSDIDLEGNVKETLIIESGLNDPMAIFLTLTFVTWVNVGEPLSWELAATALPKLLVQLGGGIVAGGIGGWILTALVNRIRLPDGLYPTFCLAGALMVFAATQLMAASGFLAIYLIGIVMRARIQRSLQITRDFHDGLSWLAQVLLFLMLGLLVTPSLFGAAIWQGLVVAAVLMLLARPLATVLCLMPCGIPVRHQIYLSWVGLRGAVPIFLAIIPVVTPGPVTLDFFNIVFVVVVASLVLQGWTVVAAAHGLGLVRQKT